MRWSSPDLDSFARWHIPDLCVELVSEVEPLSGDQAGVRFSGHCPQCRKPVSFVATLPVFRVNGALAEDLLMPRLIFTLHEWEKHLKVEKSDLKFSPPTIFQKTRFDGSIWVEWIPSKRGPQRLSITSLELMTFVLEAKYALRFGISEDEFPDWRADAKHEDFAWWTAALQKAEMSLLARKRLIDEELRINRT